MRLWARIESIPQPESRARLIGIGMMCVVALLWSGLEHFAAFIPSKLFPYQIVWVRYGVHLLFLIALLAPKQGVRHIVRTSHPGVHVFRSLLMLVMPVVFMASVRSGLHPGFVWSVTWLAVPFSAATAVILLGERVSVFHWLATFAALAGTWIAISPPLPALDWRLAMPATVALTYGLYVPLTRSLRTEHLATNLFHTACWVFLVLTICMPFLWQPISFKALAAMAIVGLWGFAVLLLIDRSLSFAPTALVGPFILTESLWSIVFDRIRSGAAIAPLRLAGAALILAACASIVAHELRRKSPQPAVA